MRDERVLLFAPHPDDESIAAGGLLQRLARAGAPVKVVYITDGENNDWAHRAWRRRWRIEESDRSAYAAMRRHESLDALSMIGIDPAAATFLHLPNPHVRAAGASLVPQLRSLIAEFAPTLIVAPSSDDLHTDHAAAAQLIAAAAAGVRSLAYVVHGHARRPPIAAMLLTPEEQRRKRRAIEAHASQMILARDRLLRHAGELEWFYGANAATPIPACVRQVKFWCSHLGDLRAVSHWGQTPM
jgi:LmbE family N-acetylglucosaminyl deacetylase